METSNNEIRKWKMNNWEKTKYIKRRENISSKKDGINEKYWINLFTNLKKIAFLAQYLDAENACNICKWQTCVRSFFFDSRKKNQQEIQLCCHSKWKRFHRKYLRCMNVNKKIIITTFAVNWKRIENFLLKRRCKNVLVHCCADRMLRHYNFRSFHSFLLLSLSLPLSWSHPSICLALFKRIWLWPGFLFEFTLFCLLHFAVNLQLVCTNDFFASQNNLMKTIWFRYVFGSHVHHLRFCLSLLVTDYYLSVWCTDVYM